METISYTYTSRADIEGVFSAVGVSLRVDDLTSTTALTAFWNDLIYEATDIINQYCEMYYAPADLATSYWVKVRTKWIGAYLLSQRRANPALFLQRYEEIIEELIQVSQGMLIIPRLPTRSELVPSLSNLIVDDRYRIRKLRVHPEISTGRTSSRQELSVEPVTDIM